jgi:hypothetical protein
MVPLASPLSRYLSHFPSRLKITYLKVGLRSVIQNKQEKLRKKYKCLFLKINKIHYYVTSYKVPISTNAMVLYSFREAHVTDVHHKLQPSLYVKWLALDAFS